MAIAERPKLRVAITSMSEQQRMNLRAILEKNGLQVTVDQALDSQSLALLNHEQADVLLLDLDDDPGQDPQLLDALLEYSSLPILFNDTASTRLSAAAHDSDWGRTLARKLIALVQTSSATRQVPPDVSTPIAAAAITHPTPNTEVRDAGTASISVEPSLTPEQEMPSSVEPLSKRAGTAHRVWVLGASIGGPQAVKSFLRNIPADLPVAFVLAQHIGPDFATLLGQQLNIITPFQVLPAKTGHVLRHQQVVIAPVEEQLTIDTEGQLVLSPRSQDNGLYRPSIDAVIMEVARCYGANAGAIIFSGMGDDGIKGCHAIDQQGGLVWAQDTESCMISSMPDRARKTGMVSFSGTPEMLAEQIIGYFNSVIGEDAADTLDSRGEERTQ